MIGNNARCPLLPILVNIVLGILARIRRKEKKRHSNKLGKSKILLADNEIYM